MSLISKFNAPYQVLRTQKRIPGCHPVKQFGSGVHTVHKTYTGFLYVRMLNALDIQLYILRKIQLRSCEHDSTCTRYTQVCPGMVRYVTYAL